MENSNQEEGSRQLKANGFRVQHFYIDCSAHNGLTCFKIYWTVKRGRTRTQGREHNRFDDIVWRFIFVSTILIQFCHTITLQFLSKYQLPLQFVNIKVCLRSVRPVLMTWCVWMCEIGVLSILIWLICKSRWNGACVANCKQAGEIAKQITKKSKKIRKIQKGKKNHDRVQKKLYIKKQSETAKKIRYSIVNTTISGNTNTEG